jgi:hypothetical protein
VAPGIKTGGRQRGAKNKRTLALEAEAAAAVAADGIPRAVPALTAILKHFMEKVAAEKAKPGGGDPAIISAALVESPDHCGGPRAVPVAAAQRGRGGSSPKNGGDREGRIAAAEYDDGAGPTGAAERRCRRAG